MEKKHCRKCLMEDLEEMDYFQGLRRYIEQIDSEIKTEESLYVQRLSVCKECKRLVDAMCNACGCFVELRAAIKGKGCPYDKW